MAFPKYESYKDSGVEWVENIPSHWHLQPIRAIFEERKERNVGSKTQFILSVMKDIGVIPYDEKGNVGNKKSENIENYKVVHVGDLVINKMNAIIGSLGISRYYGALSQIYIILYPRNKEIVNQAFFGYVFKVKPFQKSLIKISRGIMELRESIEFNEFKKISLPIPPIEEQNRIIDFLDRITMDIDQAIAKKQRLIELINEQKAILINRAVTQGLNPNVPMRDSGIEWIGEIPEHWEVKRLVFLTHLLQTGPFGSQLHQEDYIQEGIPVINPSQLTDGEIIPNSRITVSEATAVKLSRHRLIEGDIVFGRRGEMGRCGLVSTEQIGWICGTGSILFRPKTELIEPRFALIAFRCDFMKANLEYISVGATMDNLNTAILAKVSIPVPSLEEQIQIVREAQKINEDISFIVDRELASIKLLFELKQTVISSIVTGKIKV